MQTEWMIVNADKPASKMTKREMITAMAMQGIIASLTDESDMTPHELARTAVRDADALLAELEKAK